MQTVTVARMTQQQRQVAYGTDIADDFNDRYRDQTDNDRCRAAAFFLSHAVLSRVTEETFMALTGLAWVNDGFGGRSVTYNPPIDGTLAEGN